MDKGKVRISTRCAACRKIKNREEHLRKAERAKMREECSFDGVRLYDRDAPFPKGPKVFSGWRGPVDPLPWRVTL
jgi:hypothetical protein